MKQVRYINRVTGQQEPELVYGERAIQLIYGNSLFQKIIGRTLLHLFCKWPIISRLYGYLQARKGSAKKIIPFIKEYGLSIEEFAEPPESFTSFNDFFVRHLKKEARPIVPGNSVAVIPADGRYLAYQCLEKSALFSVKGQEYTIQNFLQDEDAVRYEGGSLVLARLCPTDCHRFYFPIDGIPGESHLVEGKLYSVNPIAIKPNPWIFFENRRCITYIDSKLFGRVAFVEIGATNVGSIHQTYTPSRSYAKGDEKGYFSFGGSALAIFFEPNKIKISQDLLDNSKTLETRCLIGQAMGTAIS